MLQSYTLLVYPPVSISEQPDGQNDLFLISNFDPWTRFKQFSSVRSTIHFTSESVHKAIQWAGLPSGFSTFNGWERLKGVKNAGRGPPRGQTFLRVNCLTEGLEWHAPESQKDPEPRSDYFLLVRRTRCIGWAEKSVGGETECNNQACSANIPTSLAKCQVRGLQSAEQGWRLGWLLLFNC